MLVVQSRNGVTIRLTDERWHHILERHPELAGRREDVLETLARPDMIQQGDRGELLAIRTFGGAQAAAASLVVVYREISLDDGFVVTAFTSRRPSRRRVTLWKR